MTTSGPFKVVKLKEHVSSVVIINMRMYIFHLGGFYNGILANVAHSTPVNNFRNIIISLITCVRRALPLNKYILYFLSLSYDDPTEYFRVAQPRS